MDVNFEYYRIFHAVARYGSFTRAAQALGGSQPNVTRAMNCLEHELGCTLFIRTNRGVQLTPEGERLAPRVAAAIAQLQQAEEELAGQAGLAHGSVTVGASETALNILLLERLRAFRQAYPGIRLRLSNHSTPQAIRAVRSGEVDFAVVTTPTDAAPPLREVRLLPFREILVGGRAFAGLAGQPLPLAALPSYPLICLGRESMTWRFYSEWFWAHGLELAPDTEAATTDQILPLVRCDLGLGFLPEPMAREPLRRGEIVALTLDEPVPERQVCLVYDRRRPLSAAAQRLRETVAAARTPE